MQVTMFRRLQMAVLTLVAVFLMGCGGDGGTDGGAPTKTKASGADGKRVKVAFVTNNVSEFWMYAQAGAVQAEKDFDVDCEFKMPAGENGVAEQARIMEDLAGKGVTGVAISLNDTANQSEMLNEYAKSINMICHDSDAPGSKRIAYVGSNNVKAGQRAGELIKEVLPNGGKVWLFVGLPGAQNAQERIQGIKEAIEGTKIEIVEVLGDNKNQDRAKSNVEDTITKHDDIGCLVGLWSYNGPAILNAVKAAEKAGKINIVTFDEDAETLQGIADGHIHGTVVQQPYMFAYESVRILAALARGQDAKIPANKVVEVPVEIVRKEGVKAFVDKLEKYKAGN